MMGTNRKFLCILFCSKDYDPFYKHCIYHSSNSSQFSSNSNLTINKSNSTNMNNNSIPNIELKLGKIQSISDRSSNIEYYVSNVNSSNEDNCIDNVGTPDFVHGYNQSTQL